MCNVISSVYFLCTLQTTDGIVRSMNQPLEDATNDVLRKAGNVIVVMREYYLYDEIHPFNAKIDPVALCKLSLLKFVMPRLKADACDLYAVNFYWLYAATVEDRVLDAVKKHLRREDKVHMYLRTLEHSMRTSY